MAGLFEALLELADDHLVLGHRLSEWCGHAPTLEEDLALPNMALDLIGTARGLYANAAGVEGKGQSEGDLANLRDEGVFRNYPLVERQNRNFVQALLRQLYFEAFKEPFLARGFAVVRQGAWRDCRKRLEGSGISHPRCGRMRLCGLATAQGKARRMTAAVAERHRFANELFEASQAARAMAGAGVMPERGELHDEWEQVIGAHGEYLDHPLAEMQSVASAQSGAAWRASNRKATPSPAVGQRRWCPTGSFCA